MYLYKKLLSYFYGNESNIEKKANQYVNEHFEQYFLNNTNYTRDPDIDAHYDKRRSELFALEKKADTVEHVSIVTFIILLIAFYLIAMTVGDSMSFKALVLLLGPASLGVFFYKWFRVRKQISIEYKAIQVELINIERSYPTGVCSNLDKLRKDLNLHTINQPITQKAFIFLGILVTALIYANLIFGFGS